MTILIACLSTGKDTWGHVGKLINEENWDKVFLVTNSFGKEKFTAKKEIDFIVVDIDKPLEELKNEVYSQLKSKIRPSETEMALNLYSGSGKEHMVILSSLLKLGLGIRLIAVTNKGIEEV
ncbi:hypothetical protein HYX19_02945 [Candidatus Woesearchaeota archaeon]|nr:hypothetical protein [Candidatus Woesearchaeota archaeon]